MREVLTAVVRSTLQKGWAEAQTRRDSEMREPVTSELAPGDGNAERRRRRRAERGGGRERGDIAKEASLVAHPSDSK